MKKKKSKHIPLLIMLLVLAQYTAAHVSGWLIEVGEWDIVQINGLFGYFTSHPFDITSFHLMAYVLVYGICACIYFRTLFKQEAPRAEMKGIEHGSNDFMNWDEKKEFLEKRVTPDYPYPTSETCDCRKRAEYPKRR